MTIARPSRRETATDHRLEFFRSFLMKPKEVGSIIPSSRFLERRVMRCADVESARTIVELGPGTGGTTRAVLRAMHPEARLLALEINPRFVDLIRTRVRDPRLSVHEESATAVRKVLENEGLDGADLILSGIPFSTMPRAMGLQILEAVHTALRPNGRFVAYQVRDVVETLGRQVFGRPRVQTEILNVPPMRVFRWEKEASH